MLAPLTDLVGECGLTKVTKAKGTKQAPWHWDNVHQEDFNQVKAKIAQDVVLAYPDFSMPFKIYTDGSATQLGAVITQDNRLLAFFSRKFSDTFWSTSHCRNIKRVQRNAVGPTNCCLYIPQKSHTRSTWVNIQQSVRVEINTQGIWSRDHLYKGGT